MRALKVLVVAFGSVAIGSDVQAQHAAWRWSVGVGPSMALRNESLVPQRQDPSGGSFIFGEPFVGGAEDGRFNILLSASRPLSGTALRLRFDWLYNKATSAPHPYPFGPHTPWITMPVRPALLDEFHAWGVGFDWDARPQKSWSPYVITSVGWMRSRMGWNPDSSSAAVTDSHVLHGRFVAGGLGFRASAFGRELFIEWRRYAKGSPSLGSTAVPFTFGIRF